MNARPIPTRYKGCLFRSRNEARRAVFFETLRLRWTHEFEGFRIPNCRGYLPDFYIDQWRSWAEIKSGDPRPEAWAKCRLLCDTTNQFVVLLSGEPYPERYQAYLFIPKDHWEGEPEDFYGPGEFAQSRCGHGLWFVEPNAAAICLDYTDTTRAEDSSDWPLFTEELKNAYDSARSARFEFGAQG
jgi:hypothetical protein